MNKHEFLRFSIEQKAHYEKSWFIALLTLTRETEASRQDSYPGKILREPHGIFFVNANGEPEQITGLKPMDVIFTIREPIIVERSWVPSLQVDRLETTVGRLLLNAISLIPVFGARFPYVNWQFTPKTIERILIKHRAPFPAAGESRDPTKFYVDEYLEWCKTVPYLEMFSRLVTTSITKVGLLPAPGRKAFKQNLIETKYKDKLQDPLQMAAFEKDLEEFDNAYLKQDRSHGLFMTGKVKKARMKSYMAYGGEVDGFGSSMKVTPIVGSLDEGISRDPEEFAAMVRSSWYSSYSRGAETMNGGVAAKGVSRAGDSWRIATEDCGVTRGISQFYITDEDTLKLVGQYVLVQKKPVLVATPEEALQYRNRRVEVRSPMYCNKKGYQTCEICAGKAFGQFKTGAVIPLTQISGGILTDSLKKMHASNIMTATMDLPTLIS